MASTAGHMSDFAHFSIPVTPTRPKYDSQYCPLGGSASQEYPPQPTGRGLAITQFNTHTNPGEPSVLVQCEHLSDTTSNCIAPNNPTDVKLQSPVQFPPLCPSTEQQDGVEPAVPTTPLLRTRTQTSMDEVRHKTTILQQQVQQCHSPKKRARVRKDTGRRTVTTVDGSFPIDSIELASTFKCPVEGCDKMYRRSEHMKRHIQSVHGHARYSCDWCKHTTNRWDNLKAHIKLHGTQREQPGSKPRVQFAAGAVLQYEEIMKNESRRGHDHGDLIRFMHHVKTRVRVTGLGSLVRSFDVRWVSQPDNYVAFAHPGAGDTVTLSSLLLSIASSFPRLRCILLDGYPNLRIGPAASPLTPDRLPTSEQPLLLSIARCDIELPPSFFANPYLKNLVYLDLSDMPGSLRNPLSQKTLSPANMPGLRVLKLRGREMDDTTATILFRTFGEQLWSLDLSRNKLTDDALDAINQFSFPSQTSRTGQYPVEGRIEWLSASSPSFGTFCTVTESEWSADFSHPLRHIADAPCYVAQGEAGPHPTIAPRLDGRVKILSDSADAVKTMLSGGVGSHSPPMESAQIADVCRGPQGITHLYLSDNRVSATGLSRMIRSSPGQLQRLECDSVWFRLPEAAPPSWLSKARLSGILGCAHLFRPVFSANLQVLRIHHSVVTQLLTLSIDGLSPMMNLWVAETQLLPRAELAYPEAFVPDMNPRLQSLVLTRIPRYSTGPLIDKLIAFLKLASIQERAIQDTKSASRHGPVTLLGLRHIRLEFDPDPLEDLNDDSFGLKLDFDAAAVMEDATNRFSFFGDAGCQLLDQILLILLLTPPMPTTPPLLQTHAPTKHPLPTPVALTIMANTARNG
ncbi:hypothetical protein VTH82DRAFT_314 [Thermothelomyces myriococcoides]